MGSCRIHLSRQSRGRETDGVRRRRQTRNRQVDAGAACGPEVRGCGWQRRAGRGLTGRPVSTKLPRMESLRVRADARLEAALERDAVCDPRDFFRDRLRLLKERNPAAFDEARRYFAEEVLPRVAAEDSDPVREWFEYGRKLAELTAPGQLLEIDASGRARTSSGSLDRTLLVLHLPDDAREPALILNLPRGASPAQRATCDLLVWGRTEPGDGGAP